MRLNLQTDYALRVLMHVTLQDGELVRMADIACNFAISRNHLTKIVHRLATLGYLRTIRGRNGGICLGRPAQEIGVGQVVRDIEPDFTLVECLDRARSHCRIQSVCVLQGLLQDAMKDFLLRLDQATLADLVRPRHQLQSLLHLPLREIAAAG